MTLYFDVETSPLGLIGWGVGKQRLSPENITKERQVMVVSYAFNESPIRHLKFDMSKYLRPGRDNDGDKALLTKFATLAEKADLIVAHNGDGFDIPVIKARMIKHKLRPLQLMFIDDTYKQSKKFGFSCRKLGYLGEYLGLGQKHDLGQNFRMWKRIFMGSRKDLQDACTYCDQDVKLLREVHQRLAPYTKSNYNHAAQTGNLICPSCGSNNIRKDGTRRTITSTFQRIRCNGCGHVSQLSMSALTKLQAGRK